MDSRESLIQFIKGFLKETEKSGVLQKMRARDVDGVNEYAESVDLHELEEYIIHIHEWLEASLDEVEVTDPLTVIFMIYCLNLKVDDDRFTEYDIFSGEAVSELCERLERYDGDLEKGIAALIKDYWLTMCTLEELLLLKPFGD